jgi:UDPglucose 6-dehydrogenase
LVKSITNSMPTLSVIGLGKLGSPMAAVFAMKGFPTVGVDVNADLVAAINAGRAPVSEPGLQEILGLSQGRLSATGDFEDAISRSDASFVIVPTPSGADHFFSNDHVIDAVDRIAHVLRKCSHDHLVVVTSTVMPGTMDEIATRLERISGRRIGEAVGLCYSPEFIALGSVIEDLQRPDLTLIGESDSQSGDRLAAIYSQVTHGASQIHRMNFVNAEICKIALNSFVTTKISYANMIAGLCDRIEGADCEVVTRALGSDSRIGGKYLRGATGYGGPCFPRDNKALSALGRRLGANCDLAEATDRVNDHQVGRLAAIVERHTRSHGVIAILGMSYKPNTGVIEASQGIGLACLLRDRGYAVTIFDPEAGAAASAVLGTAVRRAHSAADALSDAEVAVIATPWKEFGAVSWGDCALLQTVIDPWRIIKEERLRGSATLIVPGRFVGGETRDEPQMHRANLTRR